MVAIGGANTKLIKEIVDKQEFIGGIEYQYVKTIGLLLIYDHNCEDEDKAREVMKGFIKSIPEFKGKLISVKSCDENGRFI